MSKEKDEKIFNELKATMKELLALGISERKVAQAMETPPSHLNRVINGKNRYTLAMHQRFMAAANQLASNAKAPNIGEPLPFYARLRKAVCDIATDPDGNVVSVVVRHWL